MHRVAILGVTGRMGQSLVRALQGHPTLVLGGAVASPGSVRLGQDAAAQGDGLTQVEVTADLERGLRGAQVAIDFSSAGAVGSHARYCAEARVALLVGVTGYDDAARELIAQAARRIPVLVAPNTSVGVTLATTLVSLAAARLGIAYDIEIAEAHHRGKRDAPSGTALALGEAAAAARGQSLREVASMDRAGGGLRAPGSIGFSVLRAGDIVGEHTVSFVADGERLEITHRATDRTTFARGALRAAEWLAGRAPGLYGMRNVLGI